MRLSVRARIALAQVLPLAPMVALGVAAVLALLRLTLVVDDTRTAGVARLTAVGEAIDQFRQEAVLLARAEGSDDGALAEAVRARSDSVLASLAVATEGRPEAEQLAILLLDYERLAGLRGPAGDPAEADRAARHLLRALKVEQGTLRAELQAQLKAVAQRGRATALGMLVILAVMLLASVVATMLVSQSLVRDLAELERGTAALTAGDFSHRIALDRDDEFGRLAAAFDQMAERIAALDEMKTDFFANISHDLKTPLTSIVEAVDLLAEEFPGPLNDDQRRLVRAAQESASRLRGLVRNVLDTSRLGTRHADLQPGDLVAATDAVLGELRLLAERRGVALVREGGEALPLALVNRGMIEQVLMNLVANAIRYSPMDGQVCVQIERADPGELAVGAQGAVRVSVLDQGPGIPPEHRERVFERFFQVPERRSSGTGLGLYICRRIVETHGGRIGVEDGPGQGARLWFTLPLSGPA